MLLSLVPLVLLVAQAQPAGLAPAQAYGLRTQPSLARTTLSIDDGLPTNSISSLCYDADGLLLVGTSGGLTRYDGSLFSRYYASETPGLNGDRITDLLTDTQGRTWVGAFQAAPTVYEGGRFRSLGSPEDLHSVRQFHEDSHGVVWIAGNRLARYDGGTLHVFGEESGLPDADSIRVAEDGQGTVWVGSKRGVYRRSGDRFELAHSRPSSWILTDFQENVWTLTDRGSLVKLSGAPESDVVAGEILITDELERSPGSRLLATSGGLITMTPSRPDGSGLVLTRLHASTDSTLPLRRVNALLAASGRNLWAGTSLNGLDFYERRYVQLVDLAETGTHPPIDLVYPSGDGRAIVEQVNSKDAFLIDSSGRRTPIQAQPGWDARPLATATTEDAVWVSTRSGLCRLLGDRLVPEERWRGYAGPIVADDDGAVWMLRRKKQLLCVIDGSGPGAAVAGATFDAQNVTEIELYNGSIVGALLGKIMRFNRQLGTWEQLADLGSAHARDMRAGERGDLWISTYGEGLFRLERDGQVNQWARSAGLPDPFLAWIGPVDSDGNLWVNSNTGIQRLGLASLDAHARGETNAIEARLYHSPESCGAAGALLRNGVFALPTLEGLVLFDSGAVPAPSQAPIVSIAPPFIDGEARADLGDLAGTVSLRFDFTAPIFPTSVDAHFQTRLRGLEAEWVDVGNSRTARYPGLRAGTYALEVRARTPTSPWSSPVQSQNIVIAPLWHQRNSVRLGFLAALGLGTWLFVRARTRFLAKRNDALRSEIDQREHAEAALRSSEDRFKQLFHTAPSAIVSWTPRGSVVDHNARAAELFPHLDRDGALLRPEELFHDKELGRAVIAQALGEQTVTSVVALAATGSGAPKRCRWHFAPSLDRQGGSPLLIALVIDLSRQENDAKTLAMLRESLVRAEETERSRIARELHDDLSQRLAALAMSAHLVDLAIKPGEEEDRSSVRSFRSEIEGLATDVHALSRRLHPTIVNDLGLTKALKSEYSKHTELDGTQVQLCLAEDLEDPPAETALAVFRIAQEATRNALRHAGPCSITVDLQVAGNDLVLTVHDDGKGLGPDDAGRGGIGLNSMRERARLVGGDLSVRSDRGEGTTVVARVPRHAEAQALAMASMYE